VQTFAPDERLDALQIAALVEKGLEVARVDLVSQVESRRSEAATLEQRAKELNEQAAQVDVDAGQLEQAIAQAESVAAEAWALGDEIATAILDAKGETTVAKLELLRDERRQQAEDREEEVAMLRNRAADALRFRAEADAVRAQAAQLRNDADDLEARIEPDLQRLAPSMAIDARRRVKAQQELLRRRAPKPKLDSADEIWDPIRITGDVKGIHLPIR
jgi:hypothetical protein